MGGRAVDDDEEAARRRGAGVMVGLNFKVGFELDFVEGCRRGGGIGGGMEEVETTTVGP